MPGQSDSINKGGTLRLGSYPCKITEKTLMERCYFPEKSGIMHKEAQVEPVKNSESVADASVIHERHRHRYEFNNDYRTILTDAGLVISGQSPDGHLVETVEIPELKFFLGVQFHPEFKSRPNRPHPLFLNFIKNAM